MVFINAIPNRTDQVVIQGILVTQHPLAAQFKKHSHPGPEDFITKTMQYPEAAKKAGVQGRVILTFVVEKNGSLTGIVALQTLSAGRGYEAIRIMKLSPKWKPGMQNGNVVRVQYFVPVTFKLTT